ncbi:MAG: hypothetical protein K5891_06790 [Lachnospiraceae bacterium]|nr:hypothetical protein [Lachnospiraceae bacterium]
MTQETAFETKPVQKRFIFVKKLRKSVVYGKIKWRIARNDKENPGGEFLPFIGENLWDIG